MARNRTSRSPIARVTGGVFRDAADLAIPVIIGAAALGVLYFATRSMPKARERIGGSGGGGVFGPPRGEEVWAPFVDTLLPGQTFKAYKRDADIGYQALAAPDRTRGRIRAKNLQTNQEEDVPLYAINRLGTDPSRPGA